MAAALVAIVLTLATSPAYASPGQYNATSDEGRVACLYPLSSPYGGLWRLLFYILLTLVVAGHKQILLLAGSLTAVMAYSGTAAVHALVLAAVASGGQARFDADIAGAYAVLCAATFAVAPVLELSEYVRDSRFRPVLRAWGALVGVGMICGLVGITHYFPTEPPCPPGDGGCELACAAVPAQLLHRPAELVALPAANVFGEPSYVLWASFAQVLVLGFLPSLCIPICSFSRRRTRLELQSEIQRLQRLLSSPSPPHMRGMAGRRGGGSSTSSQRSTIHKLSAAREELRTGRFDGDPSPMAALNLVLCPVIIILNEVYLLGKAGLPSAEPPFAFSQWAPWVVLALGLIALGMTKWYEPRWSARQDTIALELADLEAQPQRARDSVRGEEQAAVLDGGREASPATAVATTTPTISLPAAVAAPAQSMANPPGSKSCPVIAAEGG